jgi:hypothetical protein
MLGLDTNQTKFLLEIRFPPAETRSFFVKDYSISVFQMTQHDVIIISLKKDLPKTVLAEITMSRGCRARFH